MDWLRLTSLLVFTFGAFAYGVPLVLSLRYRGHPSWTSFGGHGCERRGASDTLSAVLTVLSFAWFCMNAFMTLVGQRNVGLGVWTAFVAAAFLFPPVVMHVVYAESNKTRALTAPGWRQPIWIMYGVSQAVSLATLLAMHRVISSPVPLEWTGLWIGLLFVVTAIYSMAALSVGRGREETRVERSSRRWMIALFVVLIVAFLPDTASTFARLRVSAVLDLIARSMPLAFLLVGKSFESRFEFFDLLIKRGLALAVTVLLLAAWLAVVAPWLAAVGLDWAGPGALALALAPIVMALPWVYRQIGAWLDAVWLGREFTPAEAVKYFLSSVQSATTEPELAAQATSAMTAIVRAPVSINLSGPEGAPRFEAVLEFPIRLNRQAAGVVRLGGRTNRRPYFSDDVALVASLAEVFSYLLETARLQARKQEQEQRAHELSLTASRSELKALRAQINPHFLFNALNAIAGLIHQDPDRADRAVERLAEVFRHTLRRSESEWARLDDECELARAYLDVEQARFGTRLEYDVALEETVRAVRVPTMMLQTLVENAVKHGVSAVRGTGRLAVSARSEGDCVRIEVADNGPGFNGDEGTAPPAGVGGFGLWNVRQRLAGYFGDRAKLEVGLDASRGMTTVVVRLPLSSAPAADDGAVTVEPGARPKGTGEASASPTATGHA